MEQQLAVVAHFITVPVEMRMGKHKETLSFLVVLGMKRPLLLGLSWLKKRNPYVNCRKGVLKIRHKAAKKGEEVPVPRRAPEK